MQEKLEKECKYDLIKFSPLCMFMHAYMIGVSPAASFFKIHRVILSKYLSLLCGFKRQYSLKNQAFISANVIFEKW